MKKEIKMEKELTQKIKEIMNKQGYREVPREYYHKNKKKLKHGCWRIGKEYLYFIKENEKRNKRKE